MDDGYMVTEEWLMVDAKCGTVILPAAAKQGEGEGGPGVTADGLRLTCPEVTFHLVMEVVRTLPCFPH